MADTAVPAPPHTPVYVVDAVKSLGNDLWQVTVLLPDGTKVYANMAFNNVTLQSVILGVYAVGTLATTNNGASPVLRPFQ